MTTDGYHHPLDLLTDSLKVCIGHLGTDQAPDEKKEILNVVQVFLLAFTFFI